MSTKTLLKRVSLAAVVALVSGVMSAIPSSAAVGVVSTSNPTATVNNNNPVTTEVCVNGGNTDNDTVDFTSTLAGASASYTWTVTALENPKVTFGSAAPFSNTATATKTTTTSDSVQLNKTNASDQCFALSIVTLSATGGAVTAKINASSLLVLTVDTTSAGGTDTPWRLKSPADLGDSSTFTDPASIAITNTITSTTDTTKLLAGSNTTVKTGTGNFRYMEVTGSTFQELLKVPAQLQFF